MATFTVSRRTGALLAGVVPPGGIPLPQQTLGMGAWIGSPGELADPALRAQLLQLSKLRRELRAGHLLNAARISLDVRVEALPPSDPGTTRSIAVLRSVGAAYVELTPDRREDVFRSSLAMLGPIIPPMLLDSMLAPDSRLPPKSAEVVCLDHDSSPATVARLRVLLVRRAAEDYRANPDQDRLADLRKRVAEALSTPMHGSLHVWAEAVGKAAGTKNLTPLIDAVGHNLPLTNPRNGELHERLSQCFDWPHLETETRKRLARLSFSAWSTLRDATDGTGAGELVSFSAQASAFRQVFEVLLERAVLRRFLQVVGPEVRHGLLDAVCQGRATLGLGRWYGLLFASRHQTDALSDAVRRWFQRDQGVTELRDHQRLRTGLGDLLQVRLHALPHDEECARASASDVLETVVRVGFGATSALDLPQRGEGLVGHLGRVAL